jgi:hypothetical protein
MRSLQRIVLALVLGAFATGLIAGCMSVATAPTVPSAPSSSRTAQPSSLLGSLGSVVGGLVNLVFRVLNIVGSIGGSLTNGRWRVDVPPGAFDGTATVGIGVSSSTSGSCQLEISPADKNHFLTPVRLTADCSSVPSDQLKDYVIYWFNPTTQVWVPVDGSTVDLIHKTVSAPLQHFSGYAVGPQGGKAGW